MESKTPALASEPTIDATPGPVTADPAPVDASRRFDVFLSHNGRDKPVVEQIAIQLRRAGLIPWLDSWMLVPGEAWRPELEAGLMSSASCAVCIGQWGLSDWVNEEVSVAVNRAVKERGFRAFLVLLPGLPEPFDPSTLPAFLSTRTWVDLRRGVERPRDVQQLINAITGVPTGPTVPIEPIEGISPYRGLQTFDEEHAELFFGREADIQRLVEQLKETRFLAVLGSSGVGKSSLVRAGLLPALRLGTQSSAAGLTIRIFKPGARPIAELAAQLSLLEPQRATASLLDELMADTRALDLAGMRVLANNPSVSRLVWVVDQFEEVFTLCHDDRERSAFIGNLLHAATAMGGRTTVIVTMRADFYAQTARWPELAAQFAAHQYLVSPLSIDGLRQVIEQPARLVGLELEQGLTETILDDVEGQPGSLPLLEHALLEIWQRRRGHLLTLEGYRDAGTVQGAIAQRAEAVFNGLTTGQQQVVRGVLLRLTQPGEASVDTRRRARLDELVLMGMTAADVETAIGPLVDARLLTTGLDEVTGAQEVDVAHEALIRAWPRLRSWIEEDRSGLRIHRRLTEAAIDWERTGRDDGLLYRGARLATALDWHATHSGDLNDLEDTFLTESAGMRDRETRARQRRLRLTIAGLTVALLLISLTAVIAIIQRNAADEERDAAQLARDEARSREITTTAMTLADVDPELALLLLAEALEIRPTTDLVVALRDLLARQPLRAIDAPRQDIVGDMTMIVSRDGQTLAMNEIGYAVRVFRADTLDLQHEFPGKYARIAYSGDGRRIAASDLTGTVHVWDVDSGIETLSFVAPDPNECDPDGCLVQIDYSQDNSLLISDAFADHSANPVIKVWDATTGTLIARFNPEYPDVSLALSWSISPNGRLIATQSEYDIVLWEARTGRQITTLPLEAVPTYMTFSADGAWIMVRTIDGTISFFDTTSFNLVGEIPLDSANGNDYGEVALSPDSTLIAGLLEDAREIQVRNVETGALVARAGDPGANVNRIQFSPDGAWLLISGFDEFEHLLDARTGAEVTKFQRGYWQGQFTPDGRMVISGFTSASGWVYLAAYDLDALSASVEDLYRMVREQATRVLTPDERRQYLHE